MPVLELAELVGKEHVADTDCKQLAEFERHIDLAEHGAAELAEGDKAQLLDIAGSDRLDDTAVELNHAKDRLELILK